MPDASFDVVLCTQVLEHVAEPARVLAELRRVLATGGELWLTVPFVGELHEEPHDHYRYTSYGLRGLCERAGFGEVRTWPLGGYFTAMAQLARNWDLATGAAPAARPRPARAGGRLPRRGACAPRSGSVRPAPGAAARLRCARGARPRGLARRKAAAPFSRASTRSYNCLQPPPDEPLIELRQRPRPARLALVPPQPVIGHQRLELVGQRRRVVRPHQPLRIAGHLHQRARVADQHRSPQPIASISAKPNCSRQMRVAALASTNTSCAR